MNEQRRQILQMLAEGKITADEAERLIDALAREQPEPPTGATSRPKSRPRYLRVVVNAEDDTADGPARVKFDELQLSLADTGKTQQAEDLSGSQALFGIVQGAGHVDLRRESLTRTVDIGFDGYAIGGLSVGEEKSLTLEVIDATAPYLPSNKPRYLMGVGTPEDLIEAIARGVDMFDCVLPTRNGRNGQAFTAKGKINIKNARWTEDTRPLDESCACSVCRRYSRAYLRHLFVAGEMLSSILLTHHNLAFYLDTMRRVRQAIRSEDFAKFRRNFIEDLATC